MTGEQVFLIFLGPFGMAATAVLVMYLTSSPLDSEEKKRGWWRVLMGK
ncbi:hypothetical protein U0C82_09130 [Fulvimarina sp. 2208YS6-2-32]|uniref:Uncharacterized protein n=1 Tax=Fulvimarina uroteuthidis TaxID=3098149 RepID=A0ABU5I2D5_9HYPH|nr:hypothetical protein [Fulvimarina sp. 2208YS6-2-32]MDY8109302.1 hypothetical protein [Fulvimarina sp. 2208YS6-2-32]